MLLSTVQGDGNPALLLQAGLGGGHGVGRERRTNSSKRKIGPGLLVK